MNIEQHNELYHNFISSIKCPKCLGDFRSSINLTQNNQIIFNDMLVCNNLDAKLHIYRSTVSSTSMFYLYDFFDETSNSFSIYFTNNNFQLDLNMDSYRLERNLNPEDFEYDLKNIFLSNESLRFFYNLSKEIKENQHLL